jgi:hypothetical protein
VAIVLQGRDDQAKQSTRYLARGASVTALTTDLSQQFTNLTAGTSSAFENATTRMNHAGPRTIGVRVSMVSANTGTLYLHGSGATTEAIVFTGANAMRVIVNNSSVISLTVPAPTGTDVCIIAWVTEANPDTTGAGDAYRSRLLHWNVTDGSFTPSDWTTHAAIASSNTAAVFGAEDSAGTGAFAGTMTACWYEHRVQSCAEIANDWVSARSEPATAVVNVNQGHPPAADMIDAVNYHHGPSMLWAAHATRGLIRRTLSPFVNEVLRVQPEWSHALLTAADPFIRGAPDDGTWRMHLAWRRTVPVPHTCTHAWVRVHLRSWTTSGAAVPIGLRVYSMSRLLGMPLPPADQGAPDPLTSYYLQSTITRDDDASAGEFTVLGLLPLARGRTGIMDGKTCFCVAMKVDPAAASANDANARIMLRAIHIVPAFVQADGGLPFGEVGS